LGRIESKAVVRIEAAVSPRPCLGCAVKKTRDEAAVDLKQTHL
jgi:hypothetical protein